MPSTLVDSSVLLDLIRQDEEWLDWSGSMLSARADVGPLCINPIVYAEVSVTFPRREDLEEALPAAAFTRLALPWDAAFLAGKAFVRYRRRGGAKRSPLPDFYMGAHAAVGGMDLLTRDPRPIRKYFPTVRVIAP
jgi:predicted nucleic acid-binding protein